MLPGFNHNLRHLGKIYHVQTEDLGASNPVVVTQLFLVGNVLATLRTEYRDLLEQVDVPRRVRALMEEQHKAMMRKVASGAYEEVQGG